VQVWQANMLAFFKEAFEGVGGCAAMVALDAVEEGDETVGLEQGLGGRIGSGRRLAAGSCLGGGLPPGIDD
jgi:hypothetical protein